MDVSLVDSAMSREVLREIGKRPVDVSNLDVHVMHGVVYLRGRIEKLRGYYEDLDLHEELTMILRVLKQKQGIRDVVCEVAFGADTIRQRLTPHTRHVTY